MKNYNISFYTRITSIKDGIKRIFNISKNSDTFTYNKTGRHINTQGFINLPKNTNCVAISSGSDNDCFLFDVKEDKEHIKELQPKERRDYNKFTDKSFFVDYKLDGSLEITNQDKTTQIVCNDNEINIKKDDNDFKIGSDIEIKQGTNEVKMSSTGIEVKQNLNTIEIKDAGIQIKTTTGLIEMLPTGQIKIGTQAIDLLKIVQQLITTTKGLGAVTPPEKDLFTPLETQINTLIG